MQSAVPARKVKPYTQFTAPTRDSSTSLWARLHHDYTHNTISVDVAATAILAQINEDLNAMKEERVVSDCAVVMARPLYSSNVAKLNPGRRVANQVATTMFPMPDKSAREAQLYSAIHFQRLLCKLRAYHISQEKRKWEKQRLDYLAKIASHRSFCTLDKRPLSSAVRDPKAMFVEVAHKEELLPIMKFLSSDGEIVPNEKENTVFTGDLLNCVRFGRGAVYTDGRIDLCKQVVGPDHIEMLMESLVSNTRISHFLLGNNVIGERGAHAIAKFLHEPHTPQIETWYLAGNCIDTDGIGDIASALQTDPHMKYLWLKRNPLQPAGMRHIGDLLRHNNNIKILDLHNTAILDEGMEALCAGLQENDSLRHLYLGADGISPVGVAHLARYFATRDPSRKGITSLWLDMNRLGDEGAILLLESLRGYKWIKRLVLGSNGLTVESAKMAYECLVDKPNLRILDFGVYKSTADMGEATNSIGDEGLAWLMQLVKKNGHVHHLNVLFNRATVDGLWGLSATLKECPNLCYCFYAETRLAIPAELRQEINDTLAANFKRLYGEADYKLVQRQIKSSDKVRLIDSVYRNKM